MKGATRNSCPSLAAFQQELRDYQMDVVEEALAHVERVRDLPDTAPEASRRLLFACPTGTGKGSAELALLKDLRLACGVNAWIYTPSLEVLRGFLERCGCDAETLATASADKLAALGESIYCTTPLRHRNRILSGDAQPPDVIIFDEVHHAISDNEVSGLLFALAPLAAWIGFTATPFRGNPKGTADLDADWPDQVEVLSIPEAVEQGWWALPTFETVGLVDDDEIRMRGGEFAAKAAGNVVASRIDDLAGLVLKKLKDDYHAASTAIMATPKGESVIPALSLRKPTAVTVPSRDCAATLVEALDLVGVDAMMVVASTKATERARAYELAKRCEIVLVVVKVLGEGVDMPWLRRLIDARPQMSPVSWIQQLGRITRPGATRPEYVCVCRNLERHAYLLGGLMPRRMLAKAQEEFEKPSKRSAFRSIGLESLRKFKPIDIPLADGVRGIGNMLYSTDRETGAITEWAVLLDPTSEDTIVARRVSHRLETTHTVTVGDGVQVEAPDVDWGKWQRVEAVPQDLVGFATSKHRGKPTQKQKDWWARSARRFGLDPEAVDSITRRQFAALPVLTQLGCGMWPKPVTGEEQ